VLETEYTHLDMRCTNCQVLWEAPLVRIANAKTHPDARLGILLGTIHQPRCPSCRAIHNPEPIFDYYDPDQGIVVQVRPEWEVKAGGGEDWYWARYEDLVITYAEVDVRVDVVFGLQEMVDKYLGGQEAVDAARAEWAERVAALNAEADESMRSSGTNQTHVEGSAEAESPATNEG
jgi:hypothetical protein